MILCCGTYHTADEIYILKPNYSYKNRRLEILYECPSKNEKCRAYIAELTQTHKKDDKKFTIRKRNETGKKYAKALLRELDYDANHIPFGSRNNMNWIYGENQEIKDKNGKTVEIRQKAVDFNNNKKTIKHIYLPLNNNDNSAQ